MTRNVGGLDRTLRMIGAVALAAGAIIAPLPLTARILAFGLPALYLTLSALAATCLGYRLTGRSTCPTREHG